MRLKSSKKRLALHESTQRGLCRALLCLGGIVPFLAVVIASLVMATPWYRDYQRAIWEHRISESLGIAVRATAFAWTAPQQFHATGVEVRHPETQKVIARIDRIDGLMKAKGWSLILDSPALDGSQVDQGLQVLHDWFLCRPQRSASLMAIALPRGISVHYGTEVTKIDRLEVLLRPSDQTSMIQARLNLADQPFGEVTVQVSRNHGPDSTATSIELQSPQGWLPCSALSERFPVLHFLGANARFRGIIRCELQPHQWDASLNGELEQLDWGSATSVLGSPLRSLGALRLDQLNLRDGRILRAAGEFQSRGGIADKSWLQHFAKQLNLPARFSDTNGEQIAVDAIAFRWSLDTQGLVLQGLLPGPANWPPIAAQLDGTTLCTDSGTKGLQAMLYALQPPPMQPNTEPAVLDASTAILSAILPWPNAASSPATSSLRTRITRAASDGVPR